MRRDPFTALLLAAALSGCTPTVDPSTPPPQRERIAQPEVTTAPMGINEGILMFRGTIRRDTQGIGRLPREPVSESWRHRVGCNHEWCGVGWTGQPLLVDWSPEARAVQPFHEPGGPAVEVVVGGLDGQVHFLDLANGEPSRPALRAQSASIKGTPTIDPRGAPLLYVGQGLPGPDRTWHYRAYSLINNRILMDIRGTHRSYGGEDLAPVRSWGAFDGNGIVQADSDRFVLGGENGLVYRIALETDWGGQRLGLNPDIVPATYHTVRPSYGDPDDRDDSPRWCAGIESSGAIHEGIFYFADSIGSLTGMEIESGRVVMQLDLGDDTDASPVLAVEAGKAYIYIGSEVDRQVSCRPCITTGTLRFSKIDLKEMDFVWQLEMPARTCKRLDKKHDYNGGVLATAALGSGPSEELVFVSTAHEPGLSQGRLLAIQRDAEEDGTPVIAWARELHGPGWSSPATDGLTVIAGDSSGWVQAFDVADGELLWEIQLEGAVESSPVFWDGQIVVGVRGGAIVRLSSP